MRASEREIVNGYVSESIDHSPDFQALIDAENKISADAEAWVRKYFVAASMARG